MKTGIGVALLLPCTLLAGPAPADIYTWVDKDGTVHLQDEPPASGRRARKLESLPGAERQAAETAPPPGEARRSTPPPKKPGSDQPLEPKAAPNVELFTTSWCPYCKKAREYFDGRGIRFTEYDIEKDAGALRRKLGIDGGKSVPTAIIGGKVVKGYSPSGYQAALERR